LNNTKLWLANQLLDLFYKIKNQKLNLSSTERSILLALAYFAPNISPSYAAIENMTGLTRRSVYRIIKHLAANNILHIQARFDQHGDMSTNQFKIDIRYMFKEETDYIEWVGHLKPQVGTQCPQGRDTVSLGVGTECPPNYTNITNNVTKRGERASKARAVPTPLPVDFSLEEHNKMGIDLGLDLRLEFVKFKDHAASTGKHLIDWNAGFRNWLRKSAEFAKTAKPALKLVPQVQPSRHYPTIEEIRATKEAERLKMKAEREAYNELQRKEYTVPEPKSSSLPPAMIEAIKKARDEPKYTPLEAREIMRQRLVAEGKI